MAPLKRRDVLALAAVPVLLQRGAWWGEWGG
jgi:hypothetical protein